MPTLGENHPASGVFSPVPQNADTLTSGLGARWGAQATTFAVRSKNARCVLLEIYEQPTGTDARFDYWMTRGDDHVWRVSVAQVPPGTLYAFRCWGPNWPFDAAWSRGNSTAGFLCDVDDRANRFNPNKVLVDPYARELSHDREVPEVRDAGHHGGLYGSGAGIYDGPGGVLAARRTVDTGRWVPKSVVVHDTTDTGARPRIAEEDLVLYEVHLRGATRHPSASRLRDILANIPGFERVNDVPPAERGTYRAAVALARYVKALGANAVELLPVHESPNDFTAGDGLVAPPANPRGTYWGYMTCSYFAPNRRYAFDRRPGGPTREFKEMVRAFHDEGVAVVLDVVYNHTSEGGLWGGDADTAEIFSLRGLDNAEYYALTGEGGRFYWESTGCGNNLDASQPAVRQLVLDSLTYWVEEMGVDGFRFDLATVLGRDATDGYRFSGGAPLLTAIEALARERGFVLIAEAWDTQYDGGYQVGRFPPGWGEWNGRYRDALRRFTKGDPHQLLQFMSVVNGDYGNFVDQGGPQKSINFLTAHDGFTLLDLVSYNGKNNGEAWPFGPSDGGCDGNDAWDCGGDAALRRQRLRNFMVLLLLSRGVPMLRGGDEFAQTQNGNNNPYQLDSVATWHNYAMIASPTPTRVATEGGGTYHDNYGEPPATATGGNAFFHFTRFLLHLRKAYPCLRQARYGDTVVNAGGDVTYSFKKEDSRSDLQGYERALSLVIDGSEAGDADFTVFVNMHHEALTYRFPDGHGSSWRRIVDTAAWAEAAGNHWNPHEAEAFPTDATYGVHPWSVAVFVTDGPRRR